MFLASWSHWSAINGQLLRCAAALKRFFNYETGLVALLFLTWGTVFLDRMSLVYLAPFIVPELHLTHAQVGLLVSALALAWAASSLIFGIVSDRVGRRSRCCGQKFLPGR